MQKHPPRYAWSGYNKGISSPKKHKYDVTVGNIFGEFEDKTRHLKENFQTFTTKIKLFTSIILYFENLATKCVIQLHTSQERSSFQMG